ncbi:hypothetical protein ACFC58_03375 [Kitasatospora purpeofusca]|uniref:hypothetical protein n=1 Tax=Kitasatospora purpeofusca TaxID=67352 RepID=UPI0035DF4C35
MLYQLPLSTAQAWEFERDLFTDQAADLSVGLRLGMRGPVEVIARGTDLEAVEGAFAQGLQQARQFCVRIESPVSEAPEAS